MTDRSSRPPNYEDAARLESEQKIMRSSQIVLERIFGITMVVSPSSFTDSGELGEQIIMLSYDDTKLIEYIVMARLGHILLNCPQLSDVGGVMFVHDDPVLDERKITQLCNHRARMLGILGEIPLVLQERLGQDVDVDAALERAHE